MCGGGRFSRKNHSLWKINFERLCNRKIIERKKCKVYIYFFLSVVDYDHHHQHFQLFLYGRWGKWFFYLGLFSANSIIHFSGTAIFSLFLQFIGFHSLFLFVFFVLFFSLSQFKKYIFLIDPSTLTLFHSFFYFQFLSNFPENYFSSFNRLFFPFFPRSFSACSELSVGASSRLLGTILNRNKNPEK